MSASDRSIFSSSSTGLYISADCYILSNYTNASSCDEVRLNEQKLKVVAFNEATDLIVLGSRYENSDYLFMSEEPAIAGTKVTNIGYDLAKTTSSTPFARNGEIAAVMGSDFDYGKFKTDLDVMPGGSGAALIDSTGEVLGMATNDLHESNDLSRLHASKTPLITEVLAKAEITFHYRSGFSLGYTQMAFYFCFASCEPIPMTLRQPPSHLPIFAKCMRSGLRFTSSNQMPQGSQANAIMRPSPGFGGFANPRASSLGKSTPPATSSSQVPWMSSTSQPR